MPKTRKMISGFEQDDEVWLPGVTLRRGRLLRRLDDTKYWSVQVEGFLFPMAFFDHELTPLHCLEMSE